MSRPDPAKTPPFEGIAYLLSTLGYASSRRFQQVLAPLDLEPRHFAVLRAIAWSDGQPQQAIAQRAQIPPSRMVAIVDELEERGLLERRPDANDRRIRTLHVTSTGKKLLGEAFALAVEHDRKVADVLDEQERAQLREYLQRIAEALDVPLGAHSALHE
jgi:DNA-binding MarR family transcriptional regulator